MTTSTSASAPAPATTTGAALPFRDRFGKLSDSYSKFRPTYPPELYAYLAAQCPQHDVAVDLGAGNGQATMSLLAHFARVVGTDGSLGQIEKARERLAAAEGAQVRDRVTFEVCKAEHVDRVVEPESVDLVTVAQAIHWFNLDPTYSAVSRILRPNGLLAIWTYPIPTFPSAPLLQSAFRAFYEHLHAHKWWDGIIRDYVDNQYANLPFPGSGTHLVEVLPKPAPWVVTRSWTFDDLVGFLGTWSAVGRARDEGGVDIVGEWSGRLREAWPKDEGEVQVQWTIHMRVAKKQVEQY
ncbi:S-adenosyl-L-methionine-dependent methyltransferase [Catenaria anguillulae PL171]|uniref:S-adenosyl-L-methionine-dependent methyltransferase n=1 Tax=Catenaria anguillulae PL171 TaxID=765915 RepID=A0A1Y2HH20_9FUNG|nr:S-adenosyl-L-methionine-dependent methyltransferase [Catenaria anguillulae PL171]